MLARRSSIVLAVLPEAAIRCLAAGGLLIHEVFFGVV